MTERTQNPDPTLTDRLADGLHGAGIHLDGQALADALGEAGQQMQDLGQHLGQALNQMDTTQLLALAAALGWASGFRLYAVVFLVGLAGAMDWLVLPGSLSVLESPVVLFFSGLLLFTEFFADKIPGVDSLWDVVQGVIRVPAGAALAASVFGADNASMAVVAALMGGTLAATSQAAKTVSRAAINTSPEPLSNVGASLAEDGLSIGAIWLAITHPLLFVVLLVVMVLAMWWLTWMLFRFLRAAWRRLRGQGSGETAEQPALSAPR